MKLASKTFVLMFRVIKRCLCGGVKSVVGSKGCVVETNPGDQYGEPHTTCPSGDSLKTRKLSMETKTSQCKHYICIRF